jgi:caffeoyl-CoA O-methyltransferase
MAEIVNPAIEEYVAGLVPPRDPALAAVEEAARADHVPIVGPLEGQALYVFARLARVKTVLEVGSATGYSAVWLARAAKERGGSLLGIELDPKRHAEAERNLASAGLSDIARIVRGDAFEVLSTLDGQYDLVFLDLVRQLGDGAKLRRLFDLCMARVAVGGVLAIDNVLHGGEAMTSSTEGGRAADALNRLIAGDRRLISTFLTIRDGLCVSLKVAD